MWIRPFRPNRRAAGPWLANLGLWLLAGAWGSAAAQPGEVVVGELDESRYVIGLGLKAAAEYEGSDRYVLKARPLWAWKSGRFRISTSGASAIMGFASDPVGSGVSAELLRTDRLKLGAALRFDAGRQSSDSGRLSGLPDVRGTLRGRLYASYRLDDDWSVGGSVTQDLLGRQGGAEFDLGLGWRRWIGPVTSLSAGAGLSLADGRNMRTYFGITESQSGSSGLPVHAPGAGLKDVHAGVGIMTALTPRWILFANAGVSTLLGDAASSPLTQAGTSASATIGLAYRCCK